MEGGGGERASAYSHHSLETFSMCETEEGEAGVEEEERKEGGEGEGGEGEREVSALEEMERLPEEQEVQVTIMSVMVKAALLGSSAHVLCLLLSLSSHSQRGDSRVASGVMASGACAVVMAFLLSARLPFLAVYGKGPSRRLARDVLWLSLACSPLAMMGSFEGALVQSSVWWCMLPLLLLVRCCKTPTWTAYAAWSLFLAAILFTHLSSPSLDLADRMVEREGKTGLWAQEWHVTLLYIVNVMVPTTAAIYPYMLTAAHLHRAMGRAESEYADLVTERELQKQLLNLLVPRPIALRMQAGETRIADTIEAASVLFIYVQGVTELLDHHRAADVMAWLNLVFEELDACVSSWACMPSSAGRQRAGRGEEEGQRSENSVVKVETFNDFYLAMSGFPLAEQSAERRGPSAHVDEVVLAALEMARVACRVTRPDGRGTEMRVGVNSGSVCAGVISATVPRFSIFGDTVNVASRMATTAGVCREEGVYVHLSEATALGLSKATVDALYARGLALQQKEAMMQIKGKGLMQTWAITDRAPVRSSSA